MDAKHTPLSMHEISTGHGRVPKYQIRGDEFSFTVADKWIAAFIVTAVNCYDDIVEALESALKELKYGADHEAIEKAEQALAKAGA